MPREYHSSLDGENLRIAIVLSRFNAVIGDRLLDGAVEKLKSQGVDDEAIAVFRVPGAFEIPQVVRALIEKGAHDAVMCLGAVVRGETPHFDFVAGEAARGIADASGAGPVPAVFGVLTTDTLEQAMERSGGKAGNKGAEAAAAAIEMANLHRLIRDL